MQLMQRPKLFCKKRKKKLQHKLRTNMDKRRLIEAQIKKKKKKNCDQYRYYYITV